MHPFPSSSSQMGLSDDTASSYTALSSEALQIATSLSSSSAAGLTPALNMDSVVFDSDKAQHTSPDSDTDSVSSFDSAHPPSATRPFLAAANGKGLGAHMGAFSPSPRVCGKRGRSRSSSFASDGGSSVTSSGSGDSIFSRGCESGEDTPLSSQGSSASSSGSGDEDSPGRGARKAPRCRRSETAGGAAAAVAHVSSDSEVELHRLARLRGAGLACDLADMGLDVAAVDDVKSADIGSEREGKRGADSTLESQTQSAVFGLAGDSRSGKSSFVDNLVDAAATSIDAIWHAPLGTPLPFDLEDFESTRTTSSPMATSSSSQLKGTCGAAAAEGGLPLRVFIQETLRRSRTSCSTLQVALLYCIRCAFAVRERRTALASSSSSMSCKTFSQLSGSQSQTPDASHAAPFPSLVGAPSMSDTSSLCARRMFLASVMLASKFLQDRNYSARAWSRISGLAPRELARIERVLLGLVGYNLAVAPKAWESWVSKLQNATRAMGVARSATCAVMGFSTTGPGPGANQKAEMYAAHPMRRTSLSRTASDSEALAPAYDTALPEPALPGQKRDLAMQAIEARDSPLQSQSQSLPPRQQHLSITQPPLPFPRSRMCMPGGALASASHDHDIFALDRRHSSSSSSLSVSMSATPTPTPGVTPTPSCAQALGSKPAGIVTVSDPDSALASLQAQEQVQVQVQVQSGSDLAKTEVRETVAAAKWAGSMLAL